MSPRPRHLEPRQASGRERSPSGAGGWLGRPPAPQEEIDDLDCHWIEDAAGGRIERLEAMRGGGSRGMYLLDVSTARGRAELVVRRDTGGGPYAGTELASLHREAAVCRAVAAAEIPAPDVVAVSDDGRAVIASRLPGSDNFHAIVDPDEKDAVRRDFISTLGRLHALDTTALDLGDLPHPAGEGGQARAWVAVWQRLFDERVRRPAPLLRFALQWLSDHAPPDDDRTVVCHGDVGPGNFLHEGGRVTGLLDWELCHLGDPHDDLGMLALRAYQLNAFGDINDGLRTYEEATGTAVDRGRVRYYRAVALVLGLTTSVMQMDTPGEARIQMPLYLHLVPTLELLLAQALTELLGLDTVQPPDPPVALDDPPEAEALAALRDDVARLPATAGSVLGAGLPELVSHLDAAARFGPAVERADVADLADVLGARPDSARVGLAELDRTIIERRADADAVVRWASRTTRRHAALWPAWAPAMEISLQPIAD